MFTDRLDAGRQLAEKLRIYAGKPGMILAIPRGGVPVAFEVSNELHLPMDVLPVKKIGHPGNKEYAIGAVSPDEEFMIPHPDVSESYLETEKAAVRKRLREMEVLYRGQAKPLPLGGKFVIIIDDGIATGNTVLAGMRSIRRSKPEKVIVAAPVMSRQAYEKIRDIADETISLLIPDYFDGVGAFYLHFGQVSDEEVMAIMEKARINHDFH
jgi:adenine/guanine phosphoribosyltransferase-like PRPP-binding protein